MKKDDVPQDNNRTYGGHKKVIYATGGDGEYEKISSSGWEAEELVTLMAVDALNQQSIKAFENGKQGISSPLEYHMYAKRLDVLSMAQATGFFQWQIKRHLKPKIFNRLSTKKIEQYCNVLGISARELKTLPDEPNLNISGSL